MKDFFKISRFSSLEPVYDLNYFFTYRDKCNQQWRLVRDGVFDQANRSNLAQIIYWPYACNEKLWFHEASNNLAPPKFFDFQATTNFGGIFDIGHAVLPAQRYLVTNDILIKPNAKLTILPGTELNFINGVGMLVLGELSIEGIQSSPVRFSLADQQVFSSRRQQDQSKRQKFYDSSTMRMPSAVIGNFSGYENSSNNETKLKIAHEEQEYSKLSRVEVQLKGGRNMYEGK